MRSRKWSSNGAISGSFSIVCSYSSLSRTMFKSSLLLSIKSGQSLIRVCKQSKETQSFYDGYLIWLSNACFRYFGICNSPFICTPPLSKWLRKLHINHESGAFGLIPPRLGIGFGVTFGNGCFYSASFCFRSNSYNFSASSKSKPFGGSIILERLRPSYRLILKLKESEIISESCFDSIKGSALNGHETFTKSSSSSSTLMFS